MAGGGAEGSAREERAGDCAVLEEQHERGGTETLALAGDSAAQVRPVGGGGRGCGGRGRAGVGGAHGTAL